MKYSSSLEKIISTGVAMIIALGVFLGIAAGRHLSHLIQAETSVQEHLKTGELERDEVAKLIAHHHAQNAAMVSYLITGQEKPYLEEASESRNAFLEALRNIRERNNVRDAKIVNFVDRIGQTEMDYQLSASKAIDSRKRGPYFVAAAIALQDYIHPKKVELEKLLEEFTTYKNSLFHEKLETLQKNAESTASSAKHSLWGLGIISLLISLAILGVTTILLARRHLKEKRALESERELRHALTASQVVTWKRDLKTDLFEKTLSHLRLYGFTKEPPLWNFETFLRTLVPADRDRVKAEILRAIDEKSNYTLVFHVQWPDKSLHRVFSKGQILEEGEQLLLCGFDALADSLNLPFKGEKADSLLLKNLNPEAIAP